MREKGKSRVHSALRRPRAQRFSTLRRLEAEVLALEKDRCLTNLMTKIKVLLLNLASPELLPKIRTNITGLA